MGGVLEVLEGVLEALGGVLEGLDGVLEAMLDQDSAKMPPKWRKCQKPYETIVCVFVCVCVCVCVCARHSVKAGGPC